VEQNGAGIGRKLKSLKHDYEFMGKKIARYSRRGQESVFHHAELSQYKLEWEECD